MTSEHFRRQLVEIKGPIRWKVVLLVNAAMLGGCIVALFAVPPTTRFTVFGFSCLSVVVASNIYFYFVGYRRVKAKPTPDPVGKKRRRRKLMLVTAISWAILLWDLARRYWWK
jgi:hypothetical protein